MSVRNAAVDLRTLSDEQLVARSREADEAGRAECLGQLYERYYRKVSYWCLKFAGNRIEASDLAQEVFVRVQTKLDSFRMESRFSTWLYSVSRSVAVNRGRAESRRRTESLDEPTAVVPLDGSPPVDETVARDEILARFREAMRTELEPLEARVLYLHFVDGLTLSAVDELLGLENRSGARKYIVSAKRKMKRRFGRWLERQRMSEGARR